MIATTSSDHAPDPDAPLDDNSKQLDIEAEARALEYKQLEALKEQIEAAIDAKPDIKQFRDQMLIDIMSDGSTHSDRRQRQPLDVRQRQRKPLKPYTIEDPRSDGSGDYRGNGEQGQLVRVTPTRAPYVSTDEEYSNWELSVDRANAARRALVSAGFPEDKIGRVVGLGSSVPFVKDDPLNPINRRISMIVLNKKAEEALTQEAGPALEFLSAAGTTRTAGGVTCRHARLGIGLPPAARLSEAFAPSDSR